MSESSSPTPEASLVWYVAIKGEKRGPLDFDQVSRLAESGEVTGQTPCWRRGMAGWKPAESVQEMAALLSRVREEADDGPPPLDTPHGEDGLPPQPPTSLATRSTEGQSGTARMTALFANDARKLVRTDTHRSAAVGVIVGGLLGAILGAILCGLYYYDSFTQHYESYLSIKDGLRLGSWDHVSATSSVARANMHYLQMTFVKVIILTVVAAVPGAVVGFFVKDAINKRKP